MTHFHNLDRVSNQVGIQHNYGNNYYGVQDASPASLPLPSYDLGIRWGHAPQINEDHFIGRRDELDQLEKCLDPSSGRQNVVAVHGTGGMGKTQLVVQYIRQSGSKYTSVFWLNAKDEITLKAGLARLAVDLTDGNSTPARSNVHDEEQLVQQARGWLSQSTNDKWLLVYDNYDDPRLPGITSETGYDIRGYFPGRAQGSILITTRSPRLSFAKQLRLQKIEDVRESISQSLAILAKTSNQQVDEDESVIALAKRLDGLPLALATAGAYLSQTADSWGDYLELYDHRWGELAQDSQGPDDYAERTLYTTWNVSFEVIQRQDAVAAELLKLLAYFDNQDLWYELLEAGKSDGPLWWAELVQSRVRFNRAMSTLHNYSLIEIGKGCYSLHTCVHDWMLEQLNREIDEGRSNIAIRCVSASVSLNEETNFWTQNRRVLPHAQRLEHGRIKAGIDWSEVNAAEAYNLAVLYKQNDHYTESELMYMRALPKFEKALGADHRLTLHVVHSLGYLYKAQGKLADAEEMYNRALRGTEKAWGTNHTSTLTTAQSLGQLYQTQGKMAEAEEMYMRALQGFEKALGADHRWTLETVRNLGNLYSEQGKMAEAESMYIRELRELEKELGADHPSTVDTIYNLCTLYTQQGKMTEAAAMYTRALPVRGKHLTLTPSGAHCQPELSNQKNADSLPDGWEERTPKEGRVYYVDHNTRSTSWTRPGGQKLPNTLLEGWEERMTKEGRVYYVDHKTRSTSWTRPGGQKPPNC